MDARRFNIRDEAGRWLCPACGFPGYAPDSAYDESGGLIGSGICPCCLWEPGFDDDPGASATAKPTILESLRQYRIGWDGRGWWSGREADRPAGWDGAEQLRRLFEIAPHVR